MLHRGVIRPNNVQKKGAIIAGVEAELVKHIRATGGLSRIELAKVLTLSPSTIGVYVDRLLHEGYLVEGDRKVPCGAGRPRTTIALNPNAGQFVGVDFHAKEILAVSVDFAQNIVKQASRPVRRGERAAKVIQSVVDIVDEVVPSDRKLLLGIGIGSPGPVDLEHGTAVEYRYIRDFNDVPIVKPVMRRFNAPVYIENTANAMALAELWFGQGRDLNSFVSLWIRSGIGAGIIINRQLYSGLADGAGEIGAWRCPLYKAAPDGKLERRDETTLCDLQEIASVRAICDTLPGRWSTDRLIRAYRKQDPAAREVVNAAAGSLAWAIAQLTFCLAPERVVLAGPLADLGDDFASFLATTTAACMAPTRLHVPPVAMSTLGPFSGALGAAALVVDRWKPAR